MFDFFPHLLRPVQHVCSDSVFSFIYCNSNFMSSSDILNSNSIYTLTALEKVWTYNPSSLHGLSSYPRICRFYFFPPFHSIVYLIVVQIGAFQVPKSKNSFLSFSLFVLVQSFNDEIVWLHKLIKETRETFLWNKHKKKNKSTCFILKICPKDRKSVV